MRRPLSALAAVLLALAAGSCGDDDSGTAEDTGTEDTAPAGQGDAVAVDDVAELAEALEGVADGCTLEYEGLSDEQREVSICTLGSEVAELSVWTDTDALDALADTADGSGDPLVTGPNWSIDVVDPALADEVAVATGGTVHS